MDQKHLHIILDPNSREQVLIVDEGIAVGESVSARFPGVFNKTLGNLVGFEHRILLKKGVNSKVHKVRNMPFAIREEVTQELDSSFRQVL